MKAKLFTRKPYFSREKLSAEKVYHGYSRLCNMRVVHHGDMVNATANGTAKAAAAIIKEYYLGMIQYVDSLYF